MGSIDRRPQKAVLFGATGLIGHELLKNILQNGPELYLEVYTIGRSASRLTSPRLQHHAVKNLLNFEKELTDLRALLEGADVYCCLGTTIKKAGTQAAFREIDFDCVVKAGSVSSHCGARRFFVISALGADPKSKVFYSRVKGETEETLKSPSGSPKPLFIFRPSLLMGPRQEFRLGEVITNAVLMPLGPLMMGPLKKYRPIPAERVAQAMIALASEIPGNPRVEIFESDAIWKESRKSNKLLAQIRA